MPGLSIPAAGDGGCCAESMTAAKEAKRMIGTVLVDFIRRLLFWIKSNVTD
jgi:hypothetical protein